MSGEPQTAAGRALCSDLDGWEGWDPYIVDQVLAIEAEAAAARDRELRAAVEGLHGLPEPGDWNLISRKAVLGLLADPEP